MRRKWGGTKVRWARNCIELSFLAILFLFGVNCSVSWAEEKPYPIKPINMVVPYPPGGTIDLGSRIVADKIGEILRQPVLSVYKPGGGGSLGAAFVAKSKPDGYTALAGSSTPLILSPIVKKMDYKLDDFIPLGIFGESPVWLAVKADAKWKTVKDFVEDARRSPGQLKVSSYGKLTTSDFVIELLNKQAGIKLNHVPYKGAAEALTAVLGGHVDAGMVMTSGGLVEAGSIRILALAGGQRLEDLPDVPTFKELGYPIELSAWQSICVPKGTPKEVIDKLCLAQKRAFEIYKKEITEGLRRMEIRAVFLNPQESLTRFKKEYELIFAIAKELGVVAQ